jgi:6-phosphofructokinase 1
MTKKSFSSSLGSESYVLSTFPLDVWNEKSLVIADELSALDKVIVLGGSEVETKHLSSKLLHVPVSIFNNVEGSQFTLGYDTALNAIVENIESVRDTASSLSYGKVRVFKVQIPGVGSSKLLVNSALAVEAEVMTKASEEEIEHIKQHIRMKQANQEEYTFILMNHSIDPASIDGHFDEFDLDWRTVDIDDSQCGGPYPTAFDRVIANKLKNAVIEWSLSNEPSAQLLIQDNQVEFKTNLVLGGI